jgi:hypothetical protein
MISYGVIHRPNPMMVIEKMPLGASVIFTAKGGKFMTLSSGNLILSVAGDTQIDGWADISGGFTAYGTAAYDTVTLIRDLSAVFEIGVSASDTALTAAGLKALIGDTCDLVIESDVQMADTDATSTDVIQIVGGSVERNTVFVVINPIKFYTRSI